MEELAKVKMKLKNKNRIENEDDKYKKIKKPCKVKKKN